MTNACVVIPVEIPGVIGVTADGNKQQKAYYSSYGVGVTQVVAPGGDRRFQVTAAAPNGRVLSTIPSKFYSPSPLTVQDPTNPAATYAYFQGTSMASPHVAGVAALILSRFGKLSPGARSRRGSTTAPIRWRARRIRSTRGRRSHFSRPAKAERATTASTATGR